MRVKVIRAFIDKHTGKPYNPGYFYESDDPARIAELQEAGFLQGAPLPALEKAVAKPPENAMLPKALGGGWFLTADGRKVRKKALGGDG